MIVRELQSLLVLLFYIVVKPSYSSGINQPERNSNFQVLLGDVELGPLSQRPELFKVAAIQNERVIVTDDQQTAVITPGVSIRLDWSSWVSANSAPNATYRYTYYRTQLSTSGSVVGPSEVLQSSSGRIAIRSNDDMFYVEITCVSILYQPEQAIYELEVCLADLEGSDECYRSNITVYTIERPPSLLVRCLPGAKGGAASAICSSVNGNHISSRTCTVQSGSTALRVTVPCNDTNLLSFEITTVDYQPGNYTIIFNYTDIYGQTFQATANLRLSPPQLTGVCELFNDEQVSCRTNLDHHMVSLSHTCSYDAGPPVPCSPPFSIARSNYSPGSHNLRLTISIDGSQPIVSDITFQGRFVLDCEVDESTIHCTGVSGVIDEFEVFCVYDSGPRLEKCELPVTIDFTRYDRNPGMHNITIIANSTRREMADYTYSFPVQDIECAQLIEPGRITLVCAFRVMPDRNGEILCLFPNVSISVPCNDIHNIAIVPSELPLISNYILPQNASFLISGFDSMDSRIRTTLQVELTEDQPVECSTTVNCSSNSTLMSARECCVNSVDGLSYSIPGQQECNTCIVFGWLQDSFTGIEQDSAYNLSVGFLKGFEQVGVGKTPTVILNVLAKFSSARALDISLETTRIQVGPEVTEEIVLITFLADKIAEETYESLSLQLAPTPATVQTMPMGEGVFFKQEIPLIITDIDSTVSESQSGNFAEVIGPIVGSVVFLIVAATVTALLTLLCLYRRYCRTAKMPMKKKTVCIGRENSGEEIIVKSSFQLNLPPHLIIPSSSIQLSEVIGQGEFGIVYKGHVKKTDPHSVDEYLAIKTLKGFFDHGMVRDMLKECSRMSTFHHLHVLTLKGVCLDGGPAPYIIMPFMANGSLLAYLKKNRKSLVISSEDADGEDVEVVRKQLLDMCIQVAKGMEYLAGMKVVHRDLAARNCMIDANFVIKVADFGLSESIGVKEYFRQDENSAVKLPLKWLPPESINDHIFSEKSDIWAYGITCWEIFSGGKVPYAEVSMREISKLLADGYRLEKPSNNTCCEDMYSLMHQCWSGEPDQRPSFSELVESLSDALEGMAGYVHIGAFGIKTQNVSESDDH